MHDYYLLKTGKDITAERIAEADRSRLARSHRASTTHSAPRLGRSRRPSLSIGALIHRVAFF
mgnify:FL=1